MSEELTPDVLAELRGKLEAMRDRLQARVTAEQQGEGPLNTRVGDPDTDAPGDSGDSSVDLEGWDVGQQVILDADEQLADIEHALEKFAAGTYGLCELCGKPIPVARLRVVPEARYDVAHQQEVEAREKRNQPR
jgi:RNA polymerase-binding transcription factor